MTYLYIGTINYFCLFFVSTQIRNGIFSQLLTLAYSVQAFFANRIPFQNKLAVVSAPLAGSVSIFIKCFSKLDLHKKSLLVHRISKYINKLIMSVYLGVDLTPLSCTFKSLNYQVK